MREVVSRVQPHHVAYAFFAALGVDAHAIEIRGGGCREQPKIGFPLHHENAQRVFRLHRVIIQPRRPEVLIVPCNRWAFVSKHEPESPSQDELRIRQVLQHVANRPFVRCFRRRELCCRQAVNARSEGIGRFAQYVHRLSRADEVEHRGGIREGLLEARTPRPWFTDVAKASVLLPAGDSARALTALERSSRDIGPLWVFYIPLGDPAFDLVRKSERFAELLRWAHVDLRVVANPRRRNRAEQRACYGSQALDS
jgi:hypothetical protein